MAFDFLLTLESVQDGLKTIDDYTESWLIAVNRQDKPIFWLLQSYQSKKEWHEKRGKKSEE